MSTNYVSDGDLATPANFNTWLNAAGGEIYNVKASAYGAKGDGATDDSTAIQAAIDAASAAGGGVVLIPEGTYVVGTNLELKGSVHIRGSGVPHARNSSQGTILQPTSAVTKCLFADDQKGVQVEYLTIDMVNCGTTCVGLEVAGTWHSTFRHIYVYNLSLAGHTGIQYKDGTSFGPYWCLFEHVITQDSGGSKAGLSTGWKLDGDRAENQGVNATTLISCMALHHQNGYVIDAPAGLVLLSCQAEGNQTDGVSITYSAANACPSIFGGEYNSNGRYGIDGKCTVIEASINSNDNSPQSRNIVRLRHQRDLANKVLSFTSGGTTAIAVDDVITGATSGATATVTHVQVTFGSWAAGTAAGTIHTKDQSGTFQSETLNVGASTNLATISGDSVLDITGYLNINSFVKSSGLIQSPSIQRDITGATDTITADATYVHVAAETPGGPYTLTSKPHIVPASGNRFEDGQILILHNDITGNNRAVTIQDETTLAGTGIELRGPGGGTFTFTKGSVLALSYDITDQVWMELWRNSPAELKSIYTFTAADATPSVVGGNLFETGGAVTITDFDNGQPGQEITVISKHAVTFDTTSTSLVGSSADIVTASGDITRWIQDSDGTTWRLVAFVDASADNSGGA